MAHHKQHMIYRVASALAEWASGTKVNGLSDWSPHDFTVDAEKFIDTIYASTKWHTSPSREATEDSYRSDILEYLRWGIDEKHTPKAIDVCLFEVGPDYTGLDFD